MTVSSAGQSPARPLTLDLESIAPPHGGRSTADSFVAGYGLLLLLLWVPSMSYPFSTPRLMLGLLVTGPGLVLLVRLAVHRDLPAILLSAFLGCAGVSALLSRAPVESSFGILSDRTSSLALAMLGASWALGRQASPAGVRLLSRAVVLGVGVNGAVALLQVLAEPVGVLALAGGRAAAFTPNPVVLGGLVIGALAMLGYWAPRSSRWLISLPLAFALGLVGNITGTRAALAIGLVMVVLPRSCGATHVVMATWPVRAVLPREVGLAPSRERPPARRGRRPGCRGLDAVRDLHVGRLDERRETRAPGSRHDERCGPRVSGRPSSARCSGGAPGSSAPPPRLGRRGLRSGARGRTGSSTTRTTW